MRTRFLLILKAQGQTRAEFLFFAALVLLGLCLSLRDFNSFQFGYPPDGVEYTLLARTLVHESGVRIIHTGLWSDATHFPPGYPILLLPLVIGLPGRVEALPWLSLLATVINAALVFWHWRWLVPGLSNLWRYPVTAMMLLAPLTISQSRIVLSEPLFTTALLLAFIFAARLLVEPESPRWWFALGVTACFVGLTRTIGWLFIASIVFYLLITGRGKVLRGLAAAGVCVLLLLGLLLALLPNMLPNILPDRYLQEVGLLVQPPGGNDAADSLSTAAPGAEHTSRVLAANLDAMHRVLLLAGGGAADFALAARLGVPSLVTLSLILVFALYTLGNVEWARRTRAQTGRFLSLFQFSALCYLVEIVFRSTSGERYFYPIQAQLYLALLLGVHAVLLFGQRVLAALRGTSTLSRLPTTLLLLFIVAWLVLAIYRDWTLRSSYQMWGDLDLRTTWLRVHTPQDAILVSDWAALDFSKTGRETAWFPSASSADSLLAQLHQLDATFLVLATDEPLNQFGVAVQNDRVESSVPFLRELIARGHLVRVYSNGYPLQVWRIAP